MPSPTPVEEYRRRLSAHQAAVDDLDAADTRYAAVRLVTFGASGLVAIAAWAGALSWAWLFAPGLAFLVLVWRHDGIIRARAARRRAVQFYQRGIARLEDRWQEEGGATGERFRDDAHLYANDLDLFGPGSLFHLLSIAGTRAGETRLASWLQAPATRDVIRARHEAVDELAPRLDLREGLARAASVGGAADDERGILDWAAAPQHLPASPLRALAVILPITLVSAIAWWATTGGTTPLIAVTVAQLALALPLRRRVQHVLHGADAPARDLDAICEMLVYLEQETFHVPGLAALQQGLSEHEVAGSAAIRRLHRLMELHDWLHNQFFAPIGAVLLWGTHVAWAIESWRRRHETLVPVWLDAVAEFEALESLAAYRYEQTTDSWPEIVDRDSPDAPALLDARGLAHPLLARGKAVANTVRLGGDGPALLVVSGSNMSGKSTLLRTVGVAAVMALAGAPVRATALRLTPVAIGATLRIQDSLQEGRSRFYSEISRVRQVAKVSRGPLPLLFLFDELFHGTNSHDRLAGSAGVLRNLLARPSLGLVTTHDLAMTEVAAIMNGRTANVHFEDRLEDGVLAFDYLMRPGPVGHGNGLALMRAIGLSVDSSSEPSP